MAERVVIHPLNRGIRPIRIELQVDGGKVVDAKVGTTYYWDFTSVLKGKDPLDALQLSQRSSGLDFVAHASAAARALEEIAQAQLSDNSIFTRNIVLALDMIYGHITHFYQTALADYVQFPAKGPFYNVSGDYRLPSGVTNSMHNNLWRSFTIRQYIHNMMAILSGKAPHTCGLVFGGTTKTVNGAEIIRINSLLKEVNAFLNNEYSNDINQIETVYGQYFTVGAGNGNFLSVGEFPLRKRAGYLFSPGTNFSSAGINKNQISMDCTSSWFVLDSVEAGLAASLNSKPDKPGGHSWTKGAVYDNKTCEVGALPRMMINRNSAVTGLGARAASVLGRLRARLEECKVLVAQITSWLEQINPSNKTVVNTEVPEEGAAIGVAEGSQGAVVHYVVLKDSRIEKYNILDSYSWNLCPTTKGGQRGPLAQALIGLNAAAGMGLSPEILRVARSF